MIDHEKLRRLEAKLNLKKYREAAGFTQVELAGELCLALRTVQQWEQGLREPNLATLLKLKRILGTSLDDLIVEPEPKAKKGRKQ